MSKNVLQIVVKLNMFKQISKMCGQHYPDLNKIVHIFWVHSILKFNNPGNWINYIESGRDSIIVFNENPGAYTHPGDWIRAIPGFQEANLCFKIRNNSKTHLKRNFETKFPENTF